ncbi:MAG: ester cyclase [Gammaproteobacteria bacterium]
MPQTGYEPDMSKKPQADEAQRTDLESVARQWISLWCAPVDWDLFERLHADDFEDCSSAGRPTSKQGFAQGIAEFVHAFPDLRTRVDDLVIDTAAKRVAVRWSASGINLSRYLGTGPTRRLTRITGIEIIEIRRGRIMRRWGEWDISAHTGHV